MTPFCLIWYNMCHQAPKWGDNKEGDKEMEDKPIVCEVVKDIIRFFVSGPRSNGGWLLWGLMVPVTLPIWMVCQFVIGCIEVFLGELTGSVMVVDGGSGGGEGFFDEVSCRRRDDYQFITGTGKYAKENW